MKTIQWSFVFWYFLLFSVFSQTEQKLHFSGYYEPQYLGLQKQGWMQLMSNKFRLNVEKKISSGLYFYANFDYITYHGQTTWDLTNFIPDKIAAQIPVNLRPFWYFQFQDRSFLDNIYLNLYWKNARITVGKQQLTFGSGYVWNPTDIFNRKELIDPPYEQPGRNAIRVDYDWGISSGITIVFQPKDDMKHSVFYARAKTTLSHFDLAVVGALAPWHNFQFAGFTVQPTRINRKLLGWDINGELAGIGVYSEGAYHWREQKSNYVEWIAGVDYTFENGNYAMVEYYHNGLFPGDPSNLTYADWYNYLTAEYKTLSKDQIYSMFTFHPISFTTGYISQIYVPGEGSLAFLPMVEVNLQDDLILRLIGQIFTGKGDDVFHSGYGSGIVVRLRYYF